MELQQSINQLFLDLGEDLGNYTITYYCPCELCCGEESITTTGTQVAPGQCAISSDSNIPLGSKLLINGKVYTATDTGPFEGKHIDICVENHQYAIDLGTDEYKVTVLKGE
jgi:peptidoglycan DL-endopeptidase CwlO